MIFFSIHNIINIIRLRAQSSDVIHITTFSLPPPINDTSYLQSLHCCKRDWQTFPFMLR